MSKTRDNLKRRAARPTVIDGDTYLIRGLAFGVLFRADDLFPMSETKATDTPQIVSERIRQVERKAAFLAGSALVGDDGVELEYPREEGETASNYADRLCVELADVGWDKIKQINDAAAAAGSTKASVETIAKN